MGLIQTIKVFFRILKDSRKIAAELSKQQAHYVTMTTEELSELSDDDLFTALVTRVDEYVDLDNFQESFAALSEPQKVFYTLSILEAEVNNGGLCQFFVNSSRFVAPYVSKYLELIGAEDHKQLYDGFIKKHGIDLYNLSSFQIERVSDFVKQTKRYPFDEYDDAFYGLPPIMDSLTKYARNHISSY